MGRLLSTTKRAVQTGFRTWHLHTLHQGLEGLTSEISSHPISPEGRLPKIAFPRTRLAGSGRHRDLNIFARELVNFAGRGQAESPTPPAVAVFAALTTD